MEDAMERKIVGGVKESIIKSPHLASVQTVSHKVHFCAANIIGEQWMISCGHCFYLKYTLVLLKIFNSLKKISATINPITTWFAWAPHTFIVAVK